MNPEENKVLEYLVKRYKHYLRILKSSKSTIAESDYSGWAVEELEKILKHFKIDVNEM
jgi:hypothetical protein